MREAGARPNSATGDQREGLPSSGAPTFDLRSELAALGWRTGDLVRLTGRDRRTVARWYSEGVPEYVVTIVAQAKRIARLLESVGAAYAREATPSPPAPARCAGSAGGARHTLSLRRAPA